MEQNNIVLIKACKVGNLLEAKKAINEGANVNYKDKYNYEMTPLHIASQQGNIDLAKMLIMRGADVNDKSKYGLTPLHIASIAGHVEVVELLIENGANVNGEDASGKTPLDRASMNGHIEIVKLLLSQGANVDKNIIFAARNEKIADILQSWPRSMAILALQEKNAFNHLGMNELTDLDEYMGKQGPHYGGKRRNKKSKRFIKRKSNNNKKKRKTLRKRRR